MGRLKGFWALAGFLMLAVAASMFLGIAPGLTIAYRPIKVRG